MDTRTYVTTFVVDHYGRALRQELDLKTHEARRAAQNLGELIAHDFDFESQPSPAMYADAYSLRVVVMSPEEYRRLRRKAGE